MGFKSGFIAVVGRPNAGKSTLVNALVGRKVAIVTPRPQTTRNRIQGILHREDAQIIFIDTPGLIQPNSVLERQMTDEIGLALEGIDLLLLVVDAAVEFGAGDRAALAQVAAADKNAILLLNKIDRIAKNRLLPLIDTYSKAHDFTAIIPISARTGEGLPLLLEKVLAQLPEGPPYFPPDQFTDLPQRFLASEVVREKAILATREEVPHAIAVFVDRFDEGGASLRIHATLYVEREGQKGILIGQGGAMLKKIGSEARVELEQSLGRKVHLELHVKVHPKWREKPAIVRQLDWRRQLELLAKE